jgi:hypothetical protein
LADKLSITKTEQGGVVLFRLDGMLNANTEVQFVSAARQEKESGAKYLLVDMGGVVMITSAGLRALHDAMYIFTPRAEIDLPKQIRHLYKSGICWGETNVTDLNRLVFTTYPSSRYKQALESSQIIPPATSRCWRRGVLRRDG